MTNQITGNTKMCSDNLTFKDEVNNITIKAYVTVIVSTGELFKIENSSISQNDINIGQLRTNNYSMDGSVKAENITLDNIKLDKLTEVSKSVDLFILKIKEYFKPV